MLVPPESSSAVLVMVRSKSVSICNHSCARLVDSSRNRTFSRGHPHLMRSSDFLNLGGQTLHRWNLRLPPNISSAGCPGLSWMVLAQFTLKMCIIQSAGFFWHCVMVKEEFYNVEKVIFAVLYVQPLFHRYSVVINWTAFYINICCFITASDISKVETDDLQVHDHVHFAVIYLLLFAITYKRIIAYFVSNLQPILS